ncbi:helix-turn-helix transcriptional regulator [Microbacterium arabinogalactanolyticum]|uniref:helix-turn-helix transcriptional regulator n=1 Tax=Microbacterium arabinogalactanolyticum TaxID=69365 RepID=UPI0025543926|nr:helix-turn-helix transcriptional regulator [Microbacterium arabinogalactanolyticum]
MLGTLAAERAANDIEVLSRAGLPVDEFLDEARTVLGTVVPHLAACIGTHDPVTEMLTSGRKFGDLALHDASDPLFAILEYGGAESTTFSAITQAVGMRAAGLGDEGSSVRLDRLIRPMFGYDDELRLAFRDGAGLWGGIALFRGADDRAFDEREVAWAAGLSGAFARGVRVGTLAQLGGAPMIDTSVDGPAVVIIDAADEIARMSSGAQQRLLQLGEAADSTDPIGTVYALVTAARRMVATPDAALPRARVRTRSGIWLVLHASPLSACDGVTGEVVVTIEEARPSEVVDLVVAAFALTPRERDVTAMVLRGAETRDIAGTLHLSAYTVQDHLKSIFDKAGVRSRRELITKVYLDQYLTRNDQPVGPSGWYLPG